MSSTDKAIYTLKTGIETLSLSIDPEPFLTYIFLLEKWNKTYNLTAIREVELMVTRHILDSLAILPWVNGPRILDVGTGPGLPGIPLAIARPHDKIVLLDSNGKKIRFLQEVQRVLKLDNVDIVQSRVENFHPSEPFDTVTSRAFSELSLMVDLSKHLIADQGKWLAMKGHYPATELLAIRQSYRVETYSVPGLEEARCCVIIDNLINDSQVFQ